MQTKAAKLDRTVSLTIVSPAISRRTALPGAGRDIPPPQLARSLRFLESNWHRPIKVLDLARISGMSRRGFLKAFLKHTQSHPRQELERLRMSHARELVLRGQPVGQIFRACGYRSVNSFCVAFRRFNGLNAQQYLHQSRLPAATPPGRTTRKRSGNLPAAVRMVFY